MVTARPSPSAAQPFNLSCVARGCEVLYVSTNPLETHARKRCHSVCTIAGADDAQPFGGRAPSFCRAYVISCVCALMLHKRSGGRTAATPSSFGRVFNYLHITHIRQLCRVTSARERALQQIIDTTLSERVRNVHTYTHTGHDCGHLLFCGYVALALNVEQCAFVRAFVTLV